MSCIFIKPVLSDGKLPSRNWSHDSPGDYANWTDWGTSDVVDGDLLEKNWGVLFTHVNGKLNGTDIDTATAAATLSEATYIVNMDDDGAWSTRGQRHSHNGVDSSILKTGVLTASVLGDGAFGIWRSPTDEYIGQLLFNRAKQDSPKVARDQEISLPISIPFNFARWGAWLLELDSTSGATRFVAAPLFNRFASWSHKERGAPCLPRVASSLDSSEGLTTYMKAHELVNDEVLIPNNWIQQMVCVGFL